MIRLALSVLVLGLALAAPVSAAPVTARDVLGREVTLPEPARRIVLAQGRQMTALALVLADPSERLAGLGGDLRRQDPVLFGRYAAAFPKLAALPTVGEGAAETLSVEAVVALQPDLVLISRSLTGERVPGQRSGSDTIARLEAVGLTVAVIDFFIHPMADTVPSLRAIGRLTGETQRAEDFIALYERHLARIRERVARRERPLVFMHAHAGGMDCCFSPGRGTFNDMIELAGGRNMGADLLPGVSGQISLEKVIAADPAVYIATGGVHLARRGGLVLGYGVERTAARQGFARLLADPGLGAIGAVGRGRAHGFAHLFNDTPFNIVGVEVLARWLHPEATQDIDPQATLEEINRRFRRVPAEGTFWLDAPRQ